MELKEIESIHNEAMGLTEAALIAKIRKEKKKAGELFRKAYEKEREAAELITKHYNEFEPTRSVLCCSAATLAVDCGKYDDAIRFVILGLEGKPPIGIKDDLEDLKKQIMQQRQY